MNDCSKDHGPAGQAKIWDFFQNEGVASFELSRNRLRYLARKARPFRQVLNVGVGGGWFEEEAQRLGLEVYSLDPNERAISKLRERLQLGERARVGGLQEIPFADEAFGAVVVSEVFEHLDDETLRKSLAEIRRVLRPGGVLLGTVPAREELAEQMVVCPGCGEQFHRWGHQTSFTVESIKQRLGEFLRVDEAFERYFAPWNVLNWKGRMTCAAKTVLSRAGVHGRDENIVFRATKP